MHIGLAVFGTRGDVDPMVALGLALHARGHEVTMFVNPSLSSACVGPLEVVEVGAPWSLSEVLAHPRSMDPRFVWNEVYMPQIKAFFDATLATHRARPLDAIVAHVWTLGAQLAATHLGLALGCVALQPMVWMSRAMPPRLNALDLPGWLRAPTFRVAERALMRGVFAPALRRQARALGVPLASDADLPFRHFWDRARCHLGLWDPSFRPPQPDDPPRSHILGFPQGHSREALDPDLLAFCEEHRPWVMGLGSALPVAHQEPYRLALAATDEPIVLVGADADALGVKASSDRVRVVGRAPYSELFSRSRGVIHHGGVGTTAEALRAGVPQCVLAFGNDMFDNGERVVGLGAATMREARRATVDLLRTDLERLTRPEIRARAAELARALVSPEDALALAADRLEAAFCADLHVEARA